MADIELTLTVEERQAIRALTQLTRKADKFGDESEKAFKKSTTAFDVFTGSVAATIVTDALKAVGRAALDAAKDAVDAAIQFETIVTQFEVLTGSTENAKVLLEDLLEFAATTPFEINGLAKATSQLIAFGFTQDEVIGKLRELGDVAAGSGSSINEIALIFGQVSAAGKLTGERLLQLEERAIPIGPAIAKSMGVAESSVRKLVSEGKVSFDEFEKAFASLSDESGLFFEAIEKQSNTFAGVLSNLDDTIFQTQSQIGQEFIPILKELTKQFTDVLSENQEFLKGLAKETVEGFTEALILTTEAIDPLIRAFRILFNVSTLAVKGIGSSLTFLTDLLNITEGEFDKFAKSIQQDFDDIAEATTQTGIASAISDRLRLAKEAAEAEVEIVVQSEEQKIAKVNALKAAEVARAESDRLIREEQRLNESEAEFKLLRERNILLAEVDEEKFATEIAANEAKQKKLVAGEQKTSNFVLKIKRDQARAEAKIDAQKIEAVRGTFSALTSVAAFGGKTNFEIAKTAAIAEATVAGALAIQKALGSAPPPFNFILAAATGIKTAAQIRTISGTTLQTGIDSVPGTGTADNFPALLAPGERVVPTKTNQDLTEFLAGSGTQTELLQIIADRLANIEPVAMVQIGNQDILTSVNDAIDEGGFLEGRNAS